MANSKRAGWSTIYISDRPLDILGLTATQEDDFDQFLGLSGKTQDGSASEKFVLYYNKTSNPTLTDYASTPIGTVIIAPNIAVPKIYVHKAKSSTPVVGDWFVFTSAQAT